MAPKKQSTHNESWFVLDIDGEKANSYIYNINKQSRGAAGKNNSLTGGGAMSWMFKGLGICIGAASVFGFVDPTTSHFTIPVVFALGCIVYGIGAILKRLEKPKS